MPKTAVSFNFKASQLGSQGRNDNYHSIAKVGTNNIISKALCNKAQRSFQPVKAQRKMRNLFFLISEAQRNC